MRRKFNPFRQFNKGKILIISINSIDFQVFMTLILKHFVPNFEFNSPPKKIRMPRLMISFFSLYSRKIESSIA